MKNNFIILVLLFCTFLLGPVTGQEAVPEGPISEEKVLIEYGVYYTSKNHFNKEEAHKWITKLYPEIEIKDSVTTFEQVNGVQLVIEEITNVKEDFTAPSMEYLQFSARGLSQNQKETLQTANYVLLFQFFSEQDMLSSAIEWANNIMPQVLSNDNDILWDSETRECFTKTFWLDNRIVENQSVDISKHITIHLYQTQEYCRAITLGMLKFGLPEICIENLSCYSDKSIASLINLTAQTLWENPDIKKEGELSVDIDQIQNQSIRTNLLESLYENAEKKAVLNIIQGTWEEGDPANRILEIAFPKQNPQIQQDAILAQIFGFEDEVTFVKHNEAILAASSRAKAKVPELYKKFNNGLPSGTYLLIKFPFKNESEDQEWMWVEVVHWEGTLIKGLLQNEPQIVTHLKTGQEVATNIEDMFDYIILFPDGSYEGNETGKLMAQKN